MKRLPILSLLALGAAWPCLAQDLGITVDHPEGPNYRQCDIDYDKQYTREMKVVLDQIELYEDRLRDLKAARAELLDDRIWFGLGPRADSETAANIALALQVVKTTADVINSYQEQVKGVAGLVGVLGKFTRKKLSARNVYNMLKVGVFLDDTMSADGVAELTIALGTSLAEVSPLLSSAASVATGMKDALDNQEAYVGYRDELSTALLRIEAETRAMQQKIRVDERRVYSEMRTGFENFCAERKPPRARDVEMQVSAGATVGFETYAYAIDPDGGPVTMVELRNANRGRGLKGHAAINTARMRSGEFGYTAPEDFAGDETIEYVITDDEGDRAAGTVTLHVTRATGPKPGAPTNARVASNASPLDASLQKMAQQDIDAIWARCQDSTQVTQCIDDGLAGKTGPKETGRVTTQCAALTEMIASDERDLAEARRKATVNSSSPSAAMDAALARDRIVVLEDRIAQNRREGRTKHACW